MLFFNKLYVSTPASHHYAYTTVRDTIQ